MKKRLRKGNVNVDVHIHSASEKGESKNANIRKQMDEYSFLCRIFFIACHTASFLSLFSCTFELYIVLARGEFEAGENEKSANNLETMTGAKLCECERLHLTREKTERKKKNETREG